jgi:hypothetical protein
MTAIHHFLMCTYCLRGVIGFGLLLVGVVCWLDRKEPRR